MSKKSGKKRNWALIIALIMTAVLFFVACGLVYYAFGAGGNQVWLVEEIRPEAQAFVALVQARKEQGLEADNGISSFYFEDNGSDIFYLWFDAGYAPENLRAWEWIDVDIHWDRGEPITEPQLYCIRVERGLLKNAPVVNYYEDDQRIIVIVHTYELLGDAWTSYSFPD